MRLMAERVRTKIRTSRRREKDAGGFRNQTMARCGSRIALVERPIDKAIEKHRRGARENHADQDEQQERARTDDLWLRPGAHQVQRAAQRPYAKSESAEESA